MIRVSKKGQWELAQKVLASTAGELDGAISKALAAEGAYLAGQVKKKLRSGPFEKLSASTLTMRRLQGFGGKKPLIRTGDMRNAVTFQVEGGTLFVGVPRTARSKDGQSLINLAELHENGATFAMRVTPAMRRFWFGVLFKGQPRQPGSGGGSGIVIIHIPPRPFLQPVFDEETPFIAGRFIARLKKEMGGKLGT